MSLCLTAVDTLPAGSIHSAHKLSAINITGASRGLCVWELHSHRTGTFTVHCLNPALVLPFSSRPREKLRPTSPFGHTSFLQAQLNCSMSLFACHPPLCFLSTVLLSCPKLQTGPLWLTCCRSCLVPSREQSRAEMDDFGASVTRQRRQHCSHEGANI